MLESISNLPIEFLVSVGFGLIGVVGTAATFYALARGKKEHKLQKYLFEVAERNLEKEINEADLKDIKEKIAERRSKISQLKMQIEHTIPIEARKAVLKDRFDELKQSLYKSKSEIEKLRVELENFGVNSEIDEDLAAFLEKEIQPSHVLRDEQERLKTYLTMSTTATAIMATLVPYQIRLVFVFPLICVSLYLLMMLCSIYWKSHDSFRLAAMKWGVFISPMMSIVFFIGSAFLLFNALPIYRFDIETSFLLSAALFLLVISGSSLYSFFVILKSKRNYQRNDSMAVDSEFG